MEEQENEKKLLLKAIDDYEPYTRSQRQLLKAFVELAVDNLITLSVISISKIVGTSRFAVYKNLNFLEKEEVIEKSNSKQEGRLSVFRLNPFKLRNIEAAYLKKQNYLKTLSKLDEI